MLGKPTTFWGKIRRDCDVDRPIEWHPLVDHCADVAAVAETLLRLPVWRERLSRLAGRPISEAGWARLCVLAALHDLGKLNIGFQAKGRADLGTTTAGHVVEALGALCRQVFSCLSELLVWGEATTGLMVAAICHHGRPYKSDDIVNTVWQDAWWQPRGGLDPAAGARDLLDRCRAWFALAFEADDSPLPESAAFSHAFAGLVMLADWIGSDTRFFAFSTDARDRMPDARARARKAIDRMALNVPLAARTDRRGRGPFERIAPARYLPRAAQSAALGLPRHARGSVTVLEAETGSGKTEAALARFVSLFEAGLVDGLYFALPTRSAATQIHRRVHEAVQRAFEAPPAVILAAPGYLRVDDMDGERLAPFDVLWPDDDRDRLRYRTWASENSKRYLAGCIIVGTIDQVLLSSLMVGHAHLRATALLRHLLVVDEVHASDAYMGRILEDVLARHWTAGGHVLLLSATLGGEARARLLHHGEPFVPPTLAEAVGTPYPFITHRDEHVRTVPVPNDGVTRAIDLSVQPWLERPDALAAVAFAAACQGAKVLIIRNTVVDCIATQIALERLADLNARPDILFRCEGLAAPHHARFARPDRERLDLALESRFGRTRCEGGSVVVGTQTMQQSLDLDGDFLITDLCPIDVLLQRLGRLHRHERSRPAGFEQPRTIVVVPAQRDLDFLITGSGRPRHYHGLGSVYPDLRILEATWRLLERHHKWQIPGMNRVLVEHGLHSDVLGAITNAGGSWQQHENHIIGTERGESRQASLNLVDRSQPYGEMPFPDAADARIMTRLGEGDRQVRFQPAIVGPFGGDVREVTLRAPWVPDVSSDVYTAERVFAKGGATRFTFGRYAFIYDRLGLRPEASVSKEVDEDDGP